MVVIRPPEWHLAALYDALQDDKSRFYLYRNRLAICFLRQLKKQTVPLDPDVSEQLERVDYLFPDDSTLFPSSST